jgi:hypothetical protein
MTSLLERRWFRRGLFLMPLFALALPATLIPLAASAQSGSSASASPSAAPPVTVTGSVGGSLTRGHQLVVRVSATDPAGWRALKQVEITLVVGGADSDQLVYELENQSLALGAESLVVGTGGEANGSYLHVAGPHVFVTTGGPRLELTVTADVLRTIPAGARFRLSVSDFSEHVATVTRSFVAPKSSSGLTWGTVLTYIVVALVAGGFVGNLFASKRRPAARPSLYATIQRRIEQDGQPAEKGSA